MNRAVVGVAAIALFTAVAIGGVWVLTAEGGQARRAGGGGAPDPLPGPPPASAPVVAGAPALQVPPLPPLRTDVVVSPPPPEPPAGSWEAVPVAARARSLGPVGAAIGRGLLELQPLLTACFDEDTQARFGPEAYTTVRDAVPMDDRGATVLVLQIETGPGEARIVDAPVETRGTASDGLIACAQRVLRGQRFEAPQARAGGRIRLLHPLSE